MAWSGCISVILNEYLWPLQKQLHPGTKWYRFSIKQEKVSDVQFLSIDKSVHCSAIRPADFQRQPSCYSNHVDVFSDPIFTTNHLFVLRLYADRLCNFVSSILPGISCMISNNQSANPLVTYINCLADSASYLQNGSVAYFYSLWTNRVFCI